MIAEEASYDGGPKRKKGSQRRLRKKYQLVESDDDDCPEEKIVVNGCMHDQSKEVDNEDSLPISTLYKDKASERVLDQEIDDNVDKGTIDGGNNNIEDGGNIIIQTKLETENVLVDNQTHREAEPSDRSVDPSTVADASERSVDPSTVADASERSVDPSTVADAGDIKKSKKKKKGKEKETNISCDSHSIKLENAEQDEPKIDTMTEDLLAGNEQQQQHADDVKTETMDKTLPSSQVGQGQDEKPKKKRKDRSKEETLSNGDVKMSDNVALPSAEEDPPKKKRRKKEQINKASHPEGDNENNNGNGIVQDDKANKDTAGSDSLIYKLSDGKEKHETLTTENNVDNGAHDIPDGNQSEDKKVKKKKKKSKSQGNVEVVNSDVPVSVEQSSEVMKQDGNNTEDAKPSEGRTLSNGLVIQELEMGKEDGKIAALGKKISIHYTGKLKETGVEFESNAGQAPLKFRLGKGEVNESWDVGLEGMRVGEKRRLVIPPSMMSKNNEESAKIPPNSWIVYDFELVKVHR